MMQVRAACDADLAVLVEIESAAHAHGQSRAQLAASLALQQVWVLEHERQLCAFLQEQTLLDEVELHDIAVAPAWQRQGCASFLLDQRMQCWRAAGIRRIFLEVRQSNLAAQALYRTAGFAVIARRRDYYPAAVGREDALIMACDWGGNG